MDYPPGYDVWPEGRISSDGVFYQSGAGWWRGEAFVATPTEGAKVVHVDDVIEYPVRNRKQLKLKFAEMASTPLSHADAVQYCKNQGLRLPTVRELFDFCAIGAVLWPDTRNGGGEYKKSRCVFKFNDTHDFVWSSSVHSSNRYKVWIWEREGVVDADAGRADLTLGKVRCVGPAQ